MPEELAADSGQARWTSENSERPRVPVDDITVGERRRLDNGDIARIVSSLEKYGMFHPIVVDSEWRLVAGGRRLEAAKQMGWREVPVTFLGDLSEAERREIELEENLCRKDLTPYEQARELVRKAPGIAEAISGNLPEKAPQGRPAKYAAPKEDIAQALGTSERELVRAEQHVATADAYPFMQNPDWKQYHVLEAREQLERLPKPVRETAAAIMDEPAVPPKTAVALARNLAEMPPDRQQQVVSLYASDDPRDRSLAKTMAAKLPPSPDQRAVILPEVVRTLKQCARLYDDCFRPELAGLAEQIESVRKRMVAAHQEKVNSHD